LVNNCCYGERHDINGRLGYDEICILVIVLWEATKDRRWCFGDKKKQKKKLKYILKNLQQGTA
jgi:hypothetical protein